MRVARRAVLALLGVGLPAALLAYRRRGRWRERGRLPLAVAPQLVADAREGLGPITILVFWDVDDRAANRTWLPAINNLARVAAPLGLEVQGVPRYTEASALREACRSLAVGWPQRLSAELARAFRLRHGADGTPWLVLLRAGTPLYSGPPRQLVSELVALLGTYPYQDVHLHLRVVVPETEVRLRLAGAALEPGPGTWFEFGDALVGGRVYYPEVARVLGGLVWRGLPEGTFDVVGRGEGGGPGQEWFAVARVGVPGTTSPEPVTITARRALAVVAPFAWPRDDGRSDPPRVDADVPLRPRWRPVAEATWYRCRLARLRPESDSGDDTVGGGTTALPEVNLGHLPPGAYALHLEALRGTEVVGTFPPAPGAKEGDPSPPCVFHISG